MMFFSLKQPDIPTISNRPLSLGQLAAGVAAVVQEVVGADGEVEILGRLGIVPGIELSTLNSGDPAIICLPGCRIAVGRSLLSCVLVEPSGVGESALPEPGRKEAGH